MLINLAGVADTLLSLASAAVIAAIPIVVPAALKRMGVANNADLVNKLNMACEAAAGEAYKYAASQEGGLSNVNVHNGALAVGLSYVLGLAPGVVADLNLTPDHVKAMVGARLGKLLAGDPSVTAGKPAPIPVDAVPAPVQAPVPAPAVAPKPIPVLPAGATA